MPPIRRFDVEVTLSAKGIEARDAGDALKQFGDFLREGVGHDDYPRKWETQMIDAHARQVSP